MPKRRSGTVPSHTLWTEATVKAIDAYQATHHIPSFSAAAETLVRLGLEQSPAEVLEPIIVSTIRRELSQEMDRLAKLISYNIVSTGISQRLAGAAVLSLYRIVDPKTADEEYDTCKKAARASAGRTFARANIGKVLEEIMTTAGSSVSEPPT